MSYCKFRDVLDKFPATRHMPMAKLGMILDVSSVQVARYLFNDYRLSADEAGTIHGKLNNYFNPVTKETKREMINVTPEESPDEDEPQVICL